MNGTAQQATSKILSGETLIGLRAAGRMFPGQRDNQHVNSSTIFRWITRGSRDRAGALVRLEAFRVGTRWVTSTEAVGRFVAVLSADPPAPSVPSLTPAQHNRAADRSHDALAQVLEAR